MGQTLLSGMDSTLNKNKQIHGHNGDYNLVGMTDN